MIHDGIAHFFVALLRIEQPRAKSQAAGAEHM
jgi:hypothetical protein